MKGEAGPNFGGGLLLWCQTWIWSDEPVLRSDVVIPWVVVDSFCLGRGVHPHRATPRAEGLAYSSRKPPCIAGRTRNSFVSFVKHLHKDGSALIDGKSFVLVLIKPLRLWLPNLLLNNSFTFPFSILWVFKKLCWCEDSSQPGTALC